MFVQFHKYQLESARSLYLQLWGLTILIEIFVQLHKRKLYRNFCIICFEKLRATMKIKDFDVVIKFCNSVFLNMIP